MKRLMCLLSVAAVAVSVTTGGAFGAVRTWKGDADGNGNWNARENWVENEVPVNGDAIVVPESASERTLVYDLPAEVELLSFRLDGVDMGKLNIVRDDESRVMTLTATYAWTSTNNLSVHVPIRFKPSSTAYFNAGVNTASMRAEFWEPIELIGASKTLRPSYCTNKGGELHFYGTMTTADSSSIDVNGNTGGSMHFHEKITTGHMKCGTYAQGNSYFYSPENTWKDIEIGWNWYVYCAAPNVLGPSVPLGMALTIYVSVNNGHFHLMKYDQVADCLMSKAGNVATGNIEGDAGVPVTLTLNGTTNAWTAAAVNNAVSIRWNPEDDFTQAFSNRASTTTGEISVGRGRVLLGGTATFKNLSAVTVADGAVFELDVTEANALQSLRRIELGQGAVFRIGANAATPFGSSRPRVLLGKGARIEFADGATQELVVDGVGLAEDRTFLAAGEYTEAGGADWVKGAGSVTVSPAPKGSAYEWLHPVDGSWTDAANWRGGEIPPAGTAADVLIGAEGWDHVVTVPDGTALPQKLTVRNAGSGRVTLDVKGMREANAAWNWTVGTHGLIKVGTGARVFCDGNGSASCKVAVREGGEFRVDGGEAVFTNFCGDSSFAVSGYLTDTGTVRVASGFLQIAPDNSRSATAGSGSTPITLNECGLIDVSGGTLDIPQEKRWQGSYMLAFYGGLLTVRGSGLLDVSGGLGAYFVFTRNDVVFSDNAVLKLQKDVYAPNVTAGNASYAVDVRFRDHARIDGCLSTLSVGGSGGRSVLGVSSDAAQGCTDTVNQVQYVASKGRVGCQGGYGELDISDGQTGFLWAGLCVGASKEDSAYVASGYEGVVNVSGGTLDVQGYVQPGWSGNTYSGLLLGYGAAFSSRVPDGTTGRPYHGLLTISGTGTVNPVRGHMLVGTGYGKGEVRQTGGELRIDRDRSDAFNSLILGLAGGEGTYEMSGGRLVSLRSVYLGGAGTNLFSYVSGGRTHYMNMSAAFCPFERHDAIGTWSFSGGEIVVTNAADSAALVLGADGCGTFERIGAAGSVVLSGLVLSNTVENAESGGTLRFRADGTNGIGPITVRGQMAIDDHARLEVDLGDSVDESVRSFTLIEAGSIEGAFGEGQAVITGAAAKDFRISQTPRSIKVRKNTGLMVIIK